MGMSAAAKEELADKLFYEEDVSIMTTIRDILVESFDMLLTAHELITRSIEGKKLDADLVELYYSSGERLLSCSGHRGETLQHALESLFEQFNGTQGGGNVGSD